MFQTCSRRDLLAWLQQKDIKKQKEMSKDVAKENVVEEMDVTETVVEHTPDQGCGDANVEFDQNEEGASEPDTMFDNTQEAGDIEAAQDSDCIALETSDEEIYDYDPEETPDAAQVTNDILKDTIRGWKDDWDLIIEAEPNYFTKINEIRNFDPLREKADKTSSGKQFRRGYDFYGNLVNLPATYIQEQGLCKSDFPGVQTPEYYNWIDFAGERLA